MTNLERLTQEERSADARTLRRALNETRAQLDAIGDTIVDKFELMDGKIKAELSGDAIRSLAVMMAHWFEISGGINYVELGLHQCLEDGGNVFVFTVQKQDGKTPHQLKEDACAERDAAQARVEHLVAELEERAKFQALANAEILRIKVRAEVAEAERDRLREALEFLLATFQAHLHDEEKLVFPDKHPDGGHWDSIRQAQAALAPEQGQEEDNDGC